MLILGKILLILSMVACSSTHISQQSQYVEVLEATSQEWIAGVRGGGRGTDYRFSVRVKEGKEVRFDSVWVRGRRLGLTQRKEGRNEEGLLTLLASHYTGGPQDTPSKTEERGTARAPVKHEGAALIRYHLDGTAGYAEVASIAELPPIYGQ